MGQKLVETVSIRALEKHFETQMGVIPFSRNEDNNIIPENHYQNEIINFISDEESGIINNQVKDLIKYKRVVDNNIKVMNKLMIDLIPESFYKLHNYWLPINEFRIVEINFDLLGKVNTEDTSKLVTLFVSIFGNKNIPKLEESYRYNNPTGVSLSLVSELDIKTSYKEFALDLLEKMSIYRSRFWDLHSINLNIEMLKFILDNATEDLITFLEETDIITIINNKGDSMNIDSIRYLKFKNVVFLNEITSQIPKLNNKILNSLNTYRLITESAYSHGGQGVDIIEELSTQDTVRENGSSIRFNSGTIVNLYREVIDDSDKEFDLFSDDFLEDSKVEYGKIIVKFIDKGTKEITPTDKERFILVDRNYKEEMRYINKQDMEIYIIKNIYDVSHIINRIWLEQLVDKAPIKEEFHRELTEDTDIFNF